MADVGTDTYTKDKRSVIGWAMGILAAVIVLSLGFVASQLNAHDTGLAVTNGRIDAGEKRLDAYERRQDGFDGKLDKILEKLNNPKVSP